MDKLTMGSKLDKGQKLMSPNGEYELRMQDDGNLVLYDGAESVWSTKSSGSDAESLEVQDDGNVVLYKKGGLFGKSEKPVWASDTKGSNVSLTLQDDRNLVVYDGSGKALWSSKTYKAPAAATTAAAAGVTTAATKAANQPAPAATPKIQTASANAGSAPVGTKTTSAKAANAKTYKVAKGDSLWAIAERMYGDPTQYRKIAKANKIADPNLIRIGQDLIIPD